jgi:hypothetical protein
MSAVHFLPTGVFSALVAGVASNFVKHVSPKWTILGGLTLDFIGSMIIPFANSSSKYWSHLFVAFTIGTVGNMIVYTNANIAIFMKCVCFVRRFCIYYTAADTSVCSSLPSIFSTPPEIAGTVGAVFNTALQLGLALGLAIITSIQTSTDNKRAAQGMVVGYQGIADGFWFVLAQVVVTMVGVLVFYKIQKTPSVDPEAAVGAALSEGLTEKAGMENSSTAGNSVGNK